MCLCFFLKLIGWCFQIILTSLKMIFKCLKLILVICPPIRIVTEFIWHNICVQYLGFVGGILLGQGYYYYLLKKVIFPYNISHILSICISLILGIGNAISFQIRCISLLSFPMYCGKPGRSVLKAVILTHVMADESMYSKIAWLFVANTKRLEAELQTVYAMLPARGGPIMNMGYNAKEVVRVFACSTQLQYNLTKEKNTLLNGPLKKTVFSMKDDVVELKDTIRSFRDVVAPIVNEIEDTVEFERNRQMDDYIDEIFGDTHRSDIIEEKYRLNTGNEDIYQKKYLKKVENRCNDQITRAISVCIKTFEGAFEKCARSVPRYTALVVCWPMRVTYVCNIIRVLGRDDICDSQKQIDPGLGKGYAYLKKVKTELTEHLNKKVHMQYKVHYERELSDVQDAKETGQTILHAFEEKEIIMQNVINVVNFCVALLFLRIVIAAGTYHDLYLTSIEHDNVYITGYFKKIDRRRMKRKKYTLLPLKKMERNKYIDVHSFGYIASERSKLLSQVLKVMLEIVTATTFVMLDRLFYEALDVVRQHAEMDVTQQGNHDLEIQVEGTGMLAKVLRKLLLGLNVKRRVQRTFTNRECLPQPRLMPFKYFVKIYGGYLWLLTLLYFNPYTLRLRRLICSCFYPRREKQRVLHLYNDILKKRMKMQKTLRRKAVQAVRAYYLSGENLLSLSIKFPQLLGWLEMFPAARMTCLICGETEPRDDREMPLEDTWYTCPALKCPFVYCPECWNEIGKRCLACDPSLAELSDVDSLSEDEQPRY